MEINSVQVTNKMANFNKKVAQNLGDFLEILNPLIKDEESLNLPLGEINTQLLDLLVEDGENELDDMEEKDLTMMSMSNMPLIEIRQVDTPIELGHNNLLETIEVEDVVMENIVIEEELIPIREHIPLKEGSIQLAKTDILDKEFKEIDNQIDLELDSKANSFKEGPSFNEQVQGLSKDIDIQLSEEMKATEIHMETPEDIRKKQINMESNSTINFIDEVQQNNIRPVETLDTKVNHVENMERVTESIIKLVETTNEGDTQVMKVKLYPEELGNVDIAIKMEEGKLVAKILVDNDYVRQLFIDNVNNLNQNLFKQNIHIGNLEIDVNNNPNENFHEQRNNSFKSRKSFGFRTSGLDSSANYEVMEASGISILA